jgi:hypothetical protein
MHKAKRPLSILVALCFLTCSVPAQFQLPDPPPPGTCSPGGPELIQNVYFDAGLFGWAPYVFLPGEMSYEVGLEGGINRYFSMENRRADPQSGWESWHAQLRQVGQELQNLRADTVYHLCFRARAFPDAEDPDGRSRTSIELFADAPYYQYLLSPPITLSQGWESYVIPFLLRSDAPQLLPGGPRQATLSFYFGEEIGRLDIDDVSLQEVPRQTLSGAPLVLAGFEEDELWTGAEGYGFGTNARSGRSLELSIGSDAGWLARRYMPLDLGEQAGDPFESWDLTLWVKTDRPERVGRMYFAARTRSDQYFIASFGGFRPGWNEVILPREELYAPWFARGGATWSEIEELALKLESNSNGADGDLLVYVDDVQVVPRPIADPQYTLARRPPRITRINVTDVGSSTARLTWVTDKPSTSAVRCGPTTAYGPDQVGAPTMGPNETHSVLLTGLSEVNHCQVESLGAAPTPGVSGDFVIETALGSDLVPPDPMKFFPVGTWGLSGPGDQALAREAGFNAVHSFLRGSCQPSDGTEFLDAAAENGLKAIINAYCYPDALAPREAVSDGMLYDDVRARADALAQRSSLMGFYLFDEPELVQPPATQAYLHERLLVVHDAFVAENTDPDGSAFPITAGFSFYDDGVPGGKPSNPFRELVTAFVLGDYPVPELMPHQILPHLRDAGQTAAALGREWQFTVQAYQKETNSGWPGDRSPTEPMDRFPSAEEMRALAYLAITQGARGIWSYAMGNLISPEPGVDFAGLEWVWAGLTNLARELRRLEPMLASRELPPVTTAVIGDADVQAIVREHAGQTYVVTINAETAPTDASTPVTLGAPFKAAGSVVVLGEGRTLPLDGSGAFRDAWGRYGVHVYAVPKDVSSPAAAITPPPAPTLKRNKTHTITVQATDAAGVELVELVVTGPAPQILSATVSPAETSTARSFAWRPTVNGTYTLQGRARDINGTPLGLSLSFDVLVTTSGN